MPRLRLIMIALGMLALVIVINSMVAPPGKPGLQKRRSGIIPAAERQPAPEISLPIDPRQPGISLASLRGKVVMLDFWATWCGPCRRSIPELEYVYEKYHKQGLEVIGISVDEPGAPIAEAVQRLGMTYPTVLADNIPGLLDKYKFNGIPQLFVVDRSGRLAASFSGYNPSRNLESAVKAMLEE